jgi:hypothetical protein
MFKVIKALEYPVSKISALQASQIATSVNVYQDDKMNSISHHVPGDTLTVQLFTQATCAQLSATICHTDTQHSPQQYCKST